MAKKKATSGRKSPNLTIRLSEEDREEFERACELEHFDNMAQWVKVTLRARSAKVIEEHQEAQAIRAAKIKEQKAP